jgi:hypothetical protein
MKSTFICCLCGKTSAGFGTTAETIGNNAMPVADGRCCDWCDSTVVLPARGARVHREPDSTLH